MPRFPYMNLPFSYYRNYPMYNNRFAKVPHPNIANYNSNNLQNTKNYTNTIDTKNCVDKHIPVNENKKSHQTCATTPDSQNWSQNETLLKKHDTNKKTSGTDYMFDLFGLKLYFDDVLIVSLLFFLYNEGVKDEGLFIALLLLLIT